MQKKFLFSILSVFMLCVSGLPIKAQAYDEQIAWEYRVIPTTEQAVVYTFVGLINPAATDAVLAKLAQYHIKATFFVFAQEMQRYPEEVAKLIAAGHELGIAIRPAADADRETVRRDIRQAADCLQTRFGITARFVKQPYGQILDETREAVAAEGYTLIGQTYNIVQSRHKDAQTADEIMPELFGKLVYSLGRGQIVNFRMDYYTDPNLCGEVLAAVKKQKIDNVAYDYYDDRPGLDIQNDSAYTIKSVGAVFDNQSKRYEYPVRTEDIPEHLRPEYRSFQINDENFRKQLLKRYIGAPYVDRIDRTYGFSPRELRRLDATGRIRTDENVVFFTFDDWGYDAAVNKLLYVLRKHDVKGTFFIITRNMPYNPNLLRSLAAEGHEIGSHTENHRPMVVRNDKHKLIPVQTPEEYEADITLSYQKLAETVGDVDIEGRFALTRFFRPPTLAISKCGMEKIFASGYEFVVSGSCSTEDYAAKSLGDLVKRIQSGLYSTDGTLNKGTVFVMHMSDSSRYTARALDLVLTANAKRPDGDPLKFKVGLLADYLTAEYEQTPEKGK